MRAQARIVLLGVALVVAGSPVVGARGIDVSFPGPDRSPDGLALSDFTVSARADKPEVGEFAQVRFKLTNVSGQALQLGGKGIFVAVHRRLAAEDLGREERATKKGALLKPGEVVSMWALVSLDHAGTWSLWPAYETPRHAGPERWHEVTFEVVEAKREVRRLGYCSDVEKLPAGIALLGFTVFGPEGLRVGDEVTIEYHLQNRRQQPITFDAGGVYAVAGLNDKERAFGHQLGGSALAPDRPDKVLAVEATLRIDAPGQWRFRPAFDARGQSSPAGWCQATVLATP
jgi:hypothetical protein